MACVLPICSWLYFYGKLVSTCRDFLSVLQCLYQACAVIYWFPFVSHPKQIIDSDTVVFLLFTSLETVFQSDTYNQYLNINTLIFHGTNHSRLCQKGIPLCRIVLFFYSERLLFCSNLRCIWFSYVILQA